MRVVQLPHRNQMVQFSCSRALWDRQATCHEQVAELRCATWVATRGGGCNGGSLADRDSLGPDGLLAAALQVCFRRFIRDRLKTFREGVVQPHIDTLVRMVAVVDVDAAALRVRLRRPVAELVVIDICSGSKHLEEAVVAHDDGLV